MGAMPIIVGIVQTGRMEHHTRAPAELGVGGQDTRIDDVNVHSGTSIAVELVRERERRRVRRGTGRESRGRADAL